MEDRTRIEVEAAAFRRLVEHLQRRSYVQNIDIRNLAGLLRELPAYEAYRGHVPE